MARSWLRRACTCLLLATLDDAVKLVIGELAHLYDILHGHHAQQVVLVLVIEFPVGFEHARVAQGFEAVEHTLGIGALLSIGGSVVEGEPFFHTLLDIAQFEAVFEGKILVVERSAANAVVHNDNVAGFHYDIEKVRQVGAANGSHPGLLDSAAEGELAVGHDDAVHGAFAIAACSGCTGIRHIKHIQLLAFQFGEIHVAVDGELILVATTGQKTE